MLWGNYTPYPSLFPYLHSPTPLCSLTSTPLPLSGPPHSTPLPFSVPLPQLPYPSLLPYLNSPTPLWSPSLHSPTPLWSPHSTPLPLSVPLYALPCSLSPNPLSPTLSTLCLLPYFDPYPLPVPLIPTPVLPPCPLISLPYLLPQHHLPSHTQPLGLPVPPTLTCIPLTPTHLLPPCSPTSPLSPINTPYLPPHSLGLPVPPTYPHSPTPSLFSYIPPTPLNTVYRPPPSLGLPVNGVCLKPLGRWPYTVQCLVCMSLHVWGLPLCRNVLHCLSVPFGIASKGPLRVDTPFENFC